jgi:hypothetical protein
MGAKMLRFCVIENARVVFESDSIAAAGAYRDAWHPGHQIYEVVPEVAPEDVAKSIERIRQSFDFTKKLSLNSTATDSR